MFGLRVWPGWPPRRLAASGGGPDAEEGFSAPEKMKKPGAVATRPPPAVSPSLLQLA